MMRKDSEGTAPWLGSTPGGRTRPPTALQISDKTRTAQDLTNPEVLRASVENLIEEMYAPAMHRVVGKKNIGPFGRHFGAYALLLPPTVASIHSLGAALALGGGTARLCAAFVLLGCIIGICVARAVREATRSCERSTGTSQGNVTSP